MRESLFTEDGATAAEYAIMVSLIAAVVVVAVLALGGTTSELHCAPSSELARNSPVVDVDPCDP